MRTVFQERAAILVKRDLVMVEGRQFRKALSERAGRVHAMEKHTMMLEDALQRQKLEHMVKSTATPANATAHDEGFRCTF